METVILFKKFLEQISGLDTLAEDLKATSSELYENLTQTYPWKLLTPSIHKAIVHGPTIFNDLPLPIGYFSEEPLEKSIKRIRKAREFFSRKTSKKDNLVDVINKLYQSSDPTMNKQFFK